MRKIQQPDVAPTSSDITRVDNKVYAIVLLFRLWYRVLYSRGVVLAHEVVVGVR